MEVEHLLNHVLRRECPLCGCATLVVVSDEGLVKYFYEHKKVQEAFPELSASDRETILSGICKDCQDKMDSLDEEE